MVAEQLQVEGARPSRRTHVLGSSSGTPSRDSTNVIVL